MITRRVVLGGMSTALSTRAAFAQDEFPSKQVTILVGFAAGGGGDISARWIAEYIRQKWNVTAVVDNKPGAGATCAMAKVAQPKPDGYTVALGTTSPFAVAPYFQPVRYQTDIVTGGCGGAGGGGGGGAGVAGGGGRPRVTGVYVGGAPTRTAGGGARGGGGGGRRGVG